MTTGIRIPQSVALACAVLLLASGCATVPPAAVANADAGPSFNGEILRVNLRSGFVVAECAILPSPGQEARLWRDDEAAGRIRFTGLARFPYCTADLLEGEAAPGDRFTLESAIGTAAQ